MLPATLGGADFAMLETAGGGPTLTSSPGDEAPPSAKPTTGVSVDEAARGGSSQLASSQRPVESYVDGTRHRGSDADPFAEERLDSTRLDSTRLDLT